MADREVLARLAERCEKASGPGYVLDEEIFAAAHGWSYPLGSAAAGEYQDVGRCAYTASLDAAIGLVPEGWYWSTGTGPLAKGGDAYLCDDASERQVSVEAATPALALCAAALRARAAPLSHGDRGGGA